MTHSEQGAALLRAILDDPADDALRLVYADWLSDDGQEARAEFVRLQVRLEGRSRMMPDGTYRTWREEADSHVAGQWRERERALLHAETLDLWSFVPWVPPDWTMTLSAHEPAFRVGIKEGVQDVWHHLRRGFVERVVCTLDAWREHGPAVVAAHPVTRVELTDREPARHAGRYVWYDERLVTGPDVRHSLPDNDGHATTCADRETAMLYASRRLLALAKRSWEAEVAALTERMLRAEERRRAAIPDAG